MPSVMATCPSPSTGTCIKKLSLRGGNGLQRGPSWSRGNIHPAGQQARGRAADDGRQRQPQVKTSKSCSTAGPSSTGCATRTIPCPCSALHGSHRWPRRWPSRIHRGDCQGSSEPGTTIRSEYSRPRLRAGLGGQLSRGLSVRDVGRTRSRRPGRFSALSRLGDEGGCRRLRVFQRGLP